MIANALTIECWVKLEKNDNFQSIIGQGGHGGNYVMGLQGDTLYMLIWGEKLAQYTYFDLKKVPAKQWVHLAVSWISEQRMVAYVDGTYSQEIGDVTIPASLNLPLAIGSRSYDPYNNHGRFSGVVREVRLWNVARTKDQILGSMHQKLSGREPGLIGYWPCNDPFGSTEIRDRTAYGHHCQMSSVISPWMKPKHLNDVKVVDLSLYREGTEVLDHAVDDTFFFSRDRHGYIFRDIEPASNRIGLIRKPVEWQGKWCSYYQDEKTRHRFYYLPDRFELGRKSGAQNPTMSLRFESPDGSPDPEKILARLQYHASPITDPARLKAANAALLQQESISLPPGKRELDFIPLQEGQLKFHLHLPSSTASSGGQQQRQARVSLQDGIYDTLTLPLSSFQTIWDALFSRKIENTLFTGQVAVDIADGAYSEAIPFNARVQANPGNLFDAILDPGVPATYGKTLQVKTHAYVFEPRSDRPKDQIMVLLLDFGADTVQLTASQLQSNATVTRSIREIVVRGEDPGIYDYTLTIIRQEGRQSYKRQTKSEIIYPEVEA